MQETPNSSPSRRLDKALLLKKITEITPPHEGATPDDVSLTRGDSREMQTGNSRSVRVSTETSPYVKE